MPLVHGNEEIETITIFSILSRAGNILHLVKCDNDNNNNNNRSEVTLSRGLRIKTNNTLHNIIKYNNINIYTYNDCIVLPGGLQGAINYNKSKTLINILHQRKHLNKLYASICATPGVFLAKNNLLHSIATCYPSFKSNLLSHGIKYINAPYIIDNNIITGRSAGDALKFSLQLITLLNGDAVSTSVKSTVLL
jgi:4-methyl-5(b-hydroxyethyl)-thiazole monophosphate biosynthesis